MGEPHRRERESGSAAGRTAARSRQVRGDEDVLRTGIGRHHGRQPAPADEARGCEAAVPRGAGRCRHRRGLRVRGAHRHRWNHQRSSDDVWQQPGSRTGRRQRDPAVGVHADAAELRGGRSADDGQGQFRDSITGSATMLIVALTLGWTLVGGSVAERPLDQFLADLQAAATRNDRAAIAGMVHYPLKVLASGWIIRC